MCGTQKNFRTETNDILQITKEGAEGRQRDQKVEMILMDIFVL